MGLISEKRMKMKKPKPIKCGYDKAQPWDEWTPKNKEEEECIKSLRMRGVEMEREACQSLLAPVVTKCLDSFGRIATRSALEWMIKCVNAKISEVKKHEDEDDGK
jgi:hypothetical protein